MKCNSDSNGIVILFSIKTTMIVGVVLSKFISTILHDFLYPWVLMRDYWRKKRQLRGRKSFLNKTAQLTFWLLING